MKKRIQMWSYVEENGTQIVLIPVTNSTKEVLMTIEDYRKITAAGISNRLYLTYSGISRVPVIHAWLTGQKQINLAKFIAGATRDQHIHFTDCNPCNLQLSNLEVVRGCRCFGNCYSESHVGFRTAYTCREYRNGLKFYDPISPYCL